MAAYKSLQMTPPVYPVSGPGMGGRSEKVERAFIDLSVLSNLQIGDTIDLFRLHPRFRVMSGFLKSTGAAAGALLAVGDTGSGGTAANAARYFAATAITTAGTSTTLAEAGRDFLTSAYTLVQGVVSGAAPGATGTITLVLHGFIEEPA
jgi:hypothetical protein